MPRCARCGNAKLFGSSKLPPIAPYSNGPLSALVGDFAENSVSNITSIGADKEITTLAFKRPEDYFDTCMKCGSQDLEW